MFVIAFWSSVMNILILLLVEGVTQKRHEVPVQIVWVTYVVYMLKLLLEYLQDVLSDSTVEELLLGMSSQIAEREDTVLCSDVRDKLFGPMEFSRRDLGALNIMRGRDNGLPDYNTVRFVSLLAAGTLMRLY